MLPDQWLISPFWPERLAAVGIDPVDFRITDQQRFDLAWQQLTTERINKRGKVFHSFRIAEHIRALDLGTSAPPARPWTLVLPPPKQHWIPGRRINRLKAERAKQAKQNTHAGGPAPASPQPFAWTNMLDSWRKDVLSQH